VAKYNVTSGIQIKQKSKTISLTDAFAQSLINIAEDDRSVVAITAAMPGGTGRDGLL
jgi:1-deoxy-D-xylulose-5-phosphate synthase